MNPLILVDFCKKPTWSVLKMSVLCGLSMAIIHPKNDTRTLMIRGRTPGKLIKKIPISGKMAPRIMAPKPMARTHAQTIPRPQHHHSRYACLGAKVNWRSGPGSDHDVVWFYESPDWPVVVLKKYNNWYYIKDFTGELGWVKGAMLRFKTTLLITKDTPLYSKDRKGSPPKALLKKGAIVRYIRHTDGKWIYVVEPEHRLYGWVLSDTSWPNPTSL
jgi:SH3-like domain-containing protein